MVRESKTDQSQPREWGKKHYEDWLDSFPSANVLIMGTVENAMNLMNIDSFYQWIVRGGILLATVLFYRYKQRNK